VNGTLALWWGDPDIAVQYRADLLQAVDRDRAENARAPRAERDWRVSRALLQQVRSAWPADGAPALSLSHAHGHALVGTAPAGWRIGVDVEAIKARDTVRLAQWCCTGDEQAELARCADDARRLRMFYLLWTLKESFIKAANLDFPADMRSVGLAPPMDGPPWAGWRLRAPQPGWRAWAAELDDAWIASVVWRPAEMAAAGRPATPGRVEGPSAPGWHTAKGAASPRIVPAGQWSC
jgi:4'-phosphopantetheinyl transferase